MNQILQQVFFNLRPNLRYLLAVVSMRKLANQRPIGFKVILFRQSQPGLPDGIFATKNTIFRRAIWNILLQFGIFCGNSVYCVAIWCILWKFGIFCGNLVCFVAVWYILWSFGMFPPLLVCCAKNNLATLVSAATFHCERKKK
jgi:hypothetical protein